MKRNNMFMLSYIVFIFICFAIRTYCDYPMWNTLVVAISFASGVFAFADFFSGKASAELDASLVTKDLYLRTGKSLSHQKNVIDACILKLSLRENDVEDEASLKYYKGLRNKLEEESVEHSRIREMYEKGQILYKRHCRCSNCLNFIGYLSFFIILVFQSVSNLLSPSLELLSVFSFGLISLTQYMANQAEEKLNKQKKDAARICDVVNECKEALDKLNRSTEALLEISHQEEAVYAD